jgi:hypothetical protein
VLRCLRLLQREQNQAVAPIISSASRFLTPYAVLLLTAQWQQSLQYKVTAEDGLYRVERLSPAAATHVLAIAEQAADAADGVGGTPTFSTARTASLAECSCQFPSSVGLPCRHQLAVAAHLQMHDAGRLVSVAHWRPVDEGDRAALVRALLSAPLPALAAQPVARATMTKTDRFALLMSEWRGVAAAASESPAATEWALTEVGRVAAALRSAAAPAAGAAPAAAPRRRACAGGAAARAGRGPAAPAAALALLAAHEAAQEAPSGAAGASQAAAGAAAPRKEETCGECGVLGHRCETRTSAPAVQGLLQLPPCRLAFWALQAALHGPLHHSPFGGGLVAPAAAVDDAWYMAGDRSVDLGWYSRRALLMGVSAATEVFMLTDAAPGRAAPGAAFFVPVAAGQQAGAPAAFGAARQSAFVVRRPTACRYFRFSDISSSQAYGLPTLAASQARLLTRLIHSGVVQQAHIYNNHSTV